MAMYFKSLTILVLALVFVSVSFGQGIQEDRLRKEFVKNLAKSRKKDSLNKERPKLINNQQTSIINTSNDEETIQVETRLVRLDILVYDQKGNVVLGLKPEDFVITENKIEQEIGTFSLGNSEDVPRTIVLIMDYSDSQRPFIKTSVAAAKVLVDKLNPKDQMAIVTDDVELLVDFTNNKELLKSNLDKLGKKAEKKNVGRSLQYSALYVTLQEMFDNEDIRPIIIFQTDGDQFSGIRRGNSLSELQLSWQTSFTDQELIETIEASKATIYSVISEVSLLGLPEEEQTRKVLPNYKKQFPKAATDNSPDVSQYVKAIHRQQNVMSNVAQISGGFTESLENPQQADKIYENILNGINNRYLIGYYPTNQERDGTRRNIKITVKNHPEYTVLGRKFYFAPKDKKE